MYGWDGGTFTEVENAPQSFSMKQAQLGVTHSEIQGEKMGWGHRTTLKESIYWEGGTPHILCWGGDTAQHLQKKLSCGWVGFKGVSRDFQ